MYGKHSGSLSPLPPLPAENEQGRMCSSLCEQETRKAHSEPGGNRVEQNDPSDRGYEQSVGRGHEVRPCGPGSRSITHLLFHVSGLYRQAKSVTFLILFWGGEV